MKRFIYDELKKWKQSETRIRFSMKGFKEQEWMTNIPLYAVRAFIK